MVGFSGGIDAEDTGIAPRPICFGQFALAGVLLAYSHDSASIKRATGFNFLPVEQARAMHEHLLALYEQGGIRSRYAVPGPMSHAEPNLLLFQRYLARKLT